MKMDFWRIVFYHFILFFITTYATDPCTNHVTKQNQESRSSENQLDMSTETPINDVMLTDGWYRIVSSNGDDMPTEPPASLKCGTWYPIWLNDTLPLATDGIVTKKVCLRSFKSECSNSWNIEIKKCDTYYVYNLISSITENSAYCFVDFPVKNVTKAEVIVDLVPGPKVHPWFEFSLATAFTCKFDEVFGDDGGVFVYDVHWYINDQSVILHTGIEYSNIGNTNLTESDWIGKHRLNMVVRCSVRLRYNVGLTPGHVVNSASFAAGIYPEKYEYQVKENQEIEIKLINTMPVGCFGYTDSARKGCAYKLRLAQPKYQKNCDQNNCDICDGTVQPGELSFERADCSYNITSATWDQPLILKVTGYVNGQYDYVDRTTYLKVLSQENNYYVDKDIFAWDDVQIPEIKIIVTDDEHQMSGRVCESFNDPHFYTSDRYRWDDYKPGEYILYKHKTKPYQVNALYGICNNGIANCNCGVAIRSGHSMFVMRTCDYITQYETRTHSPTIEMRTCDDSSMIIKENGGTYTVTLPIGTEIKFSTSSGWGHDQFIGYIHVKPSLLDVKNSEGLCGYVSAGSKDTSDDFTLRNGTILATTSANWEAFAENWRVSDAERFFVDHPIALSQAINLQQYCICETEEDSGTPLNEFAYKCGLEGPLKSCLAQTADAGNFHTTCSSSRRRRSAGRHHIITKSLTDSDDIIDNREMYIAPDSELSAVETKHIDEWPGDWTETKAREVCQSSITKSVGDEILETSHTKSDGYIETCMFDIKLAGDIRFLEATVSSLQEVAISEISRNVSLFIKDNATETDTANATTSNTKKSIGEMLLGGLCKNDCSNNGVCQKGVCICNHGFGKQDCSEDLTLPPRNITIPMNGICNTRDRLCAKTNIQGVFNSRNITCRSRHLEILKDGNWRYISDYQTYDGQYRNSYLVSCELPTDRRKRRSTSESIIADGYEISLSTDGNNFGDSVKIMIYDLECFSCYMENNTCTELDSCPLETTTEATTEPLSSTSPPISISNTSTTNKFTTFNPATITSEASTSTSSSYTTPMLKESTLKTSPASESNTEDINTSTSKKSIDGATTEPLASTSPLISTTETSTTTKSATFNPAISITPRSTSTTSSPTTPMLKESTIKSSSESESIPETSNTSTQKKTTTEPTTAPISSTNTPMTLTNTSTTTKSTTFNPASSITSGASTSTTSSSTIKMLKETTIETSSTSVSKTEASTPKNENIESNEIAAILGGLTGVVVLIIIILSGMIYYKMKVKKNGHMEDNLVYQFQVPPNQTAMKPQFPDKYNREKSSNSIGNVSLNLETDNISRPRTPVELFSVEYNQQ
ncbi:von Willebrand factor D and EGF domain-containing protein-like isoform X2 [Mytilus galloprovincialis]|uniref:von Willebrand factor D and EGF domain-containing protein-like isoform X2 n=1 Tax=Mytilus galloprovincialis TaxID=29158 RepID=UPI003F7B9A58